MSNYTSVLGLDCIASDPASTILYGITTGYSNTGENVKSFFLVKSSPNPDHVSLGMWSMVSEEKSIPFSYWKPRFKSIDCSVSSKGVFTAFFNNGQLLTPGTVNVPVGVRYDPETQEWTSIRTSTLYGWATDDWTHTSFYINNGGVESLVHMLTDRENTVIRFGVLNESENVLQLASVWKQDRRTGEYTSGDMLDTKVTEWSDYARLYADLGAFGKPHFSLQKKMIYANGRLYMMYYNYPENVTIDSIAFTDPAAPPSTDHQTFKGPANFRSEYFFTGTRGNTTFLGGLGTYRKTSMGEEYSSFTMDLVDGVLQTPVVHTSPFYNYTTTKYSYYNSTTNEYSRISETGTVSIHEDFVTVGGRLPGQNPFIVGLASEGIYEFSIVGANGTTTLGLVNVIVPGIVNSLGHRAVNLVDHLRESRSKSANAKPNIPDAEIAGIAVACILGLYLIVVFNKTYKAKKRAAAEAQRREQHQDQDIELGARSSTMGAAVPSTTTNRAMIAYEERIANQYLTSDPPPEFDTSVDDVHSTPPTYARDEVQVPEYSPNARPNTVTSVDDSHSTPPTYARD
ncbi:hypothetical protein BKA57DRAFT_534802 [Linnemannia elongata]|nr:hypothetical protein BKA57DRAFT_534802 [Linnemannia elongata]